jgi:hypothetical protein
MDSLPKLYLFSISYSLHSTSFDQREVATVEHRPLRCTIVKGSRAGLPPAQRMIFKALIHLFKLAASEFSNSKATYQTVRLYSKMISIKANAKAQSSTRVSSGRRNNLLRISGCKATPFGKLGVQLWTPGEDKADNPSSRSRQAA